MSPEVAVPLLMLGGTVLVALGAVVVWRLWFRSLYPNCTCWICGRRR
ncbi:hypothetical protein ACQP1P_38720 [Dactylosporangium sp. CA-052675]